MLMKWEDLMPGDVVRIAKEAKEYWKNKSVDDNIYWVKRYCNKNHIVIDIKKSIGWIEVKTSLGRFYIENNGIELYSSYDGPLFEIVSLKDDD